MSQVALYWKAIIGFFAPGATMLGQALLDSSPGGDAITRAEWLNAAITCVVTASLVYSVPNRRPDPEPTEVP